MSYKPNSDDTGNVSDWYFTSFAQVGGGEGVAAGAWIFQFKSQTARIQPAVAFL